MGKHVGSGSNETKYSGGEGRNTFYYAEKGFRGSICRGPFKTALFERSNLNWKNFVNHTF
ncbi:hypothetical protein AS888_03490 [Peribacillus simplex]|uniref:Uncharacterized protein n=1 Tax=Peribacillus simplex TaxID=1478 RepID=A0A109N398_9BACI|nr:hypothetical protein AS888_03490 [Peribacillus simplex]